MMGWLIIFDYFSKFKISKKIKSKNFNFRLHLKKIYQILEIQKF